MALKIKTGVKIHAYGPGENHFDSESALSQAVLEHLQSRFPEAIEDDAKEVKKKAPAKGKEVESDLL